MYPYQGPPGFNGGPMGPPTGYYEMSNPHPPMPPPHPARQLPHPSMAGPPPSMTSYPAYYHTYYPHGPPQFPPISGSFNWNEETPPASNGYVSRCMSSTIDTPDDRSEVDSDIYESSTRSKGILTSKQLLATTAQMPRSKARASDTCSVDSDYMTSQKKDDKIKWSTSKKELPTDPIEAKRIIKRRERNREATAKSRSRLIKRAQRGDRLYDLLGDIGTHFGNILVELTKLHVAKIGEQLRLAGVDTARLIKESDELKRKINKAKDNVEDIDSS